MVILDTNVVIERIRNREEVRDNITAVTFCRISENRILQEISR